MFRPSLLILAFCLSTAFLCADEWRGFRGLEKEGANDPAAGVLHWAPDKNVRWKTAIPGSGYSAPVVSGNRVYLTTAYETTKGKHFIRLLYWVRTSLISLLVLATVPVLIRALSYHWWGKRTKLAASGVMAITLLLFLFAFFDINLFNFARCPIRVWIVTSAEASVCVISAAILLPQQGLARRFLGIGLIAFAAIFALEVPVRDHAWRSAGPNWIVMVSITAIPALIGTLILTGYFFPLRPDALDLRSGNEMAPDPHWRRNVLHAALFCAATIALGLAVAALISRVPYTVGVTHNAFDYLSYHLAGWRPTPNFGWWSFIAVGTLLSAWIVAHLLHPGLRSYFSGAVQVRFQQGLALAAAAAVMLPNIFLSRREFVRAIVCVDADQGGIIWQCEGLAGPEEQVTMNSPATPTPVVGTDYVCGYFGTPGLMCAGMDGTIRWIRNDLPFESPYGVGVSPILHDDVLIIASASPKAPYVCAIDGKAGRTLWKTSQPGTKQPEGSSRTPIIKQVGGSTAILVWDSECFYGFDFHTGAQLWSLPTPFARGDMVASIASDGRAVFLASQDSIRAFDLAKVASAEDALLWEQSEAGANCSSPAVCQGKLFAVSDDGHAVCLDPRDGAVIWSGELDGQYMASVVGAGNYVYFANDSGRTTVVSSKPTPQKVAENFLDERLHATPAPVGSRIYLRTEKNLYCLETQ